ncbi:hypothetical protein DSL72_006371 [Monilinia vaccinii-corymbosi]|uniref:ZZ-type domain-containing protein n=1 Tax=Monilinia vaccinii-corymbosi TaxID=61207 RepID=A0A8A3PNN3_9HELO|nr:hypothetical protein DSL72_006371 [Monilinia vaccinii-corymbosi]
MATVPPPSPDTLVTLKINIEGINRRFKLPLRDLGASTLPDKLRYLLAIPPTSEAIFERYSDSAAAFIVLDASNPSVYKQLYRAAKAKLKLRLKVTVKDKEPVMPKPATVEDEEPVPAKSVESLKFAPISASKEHLEMTQATTEHLEVAHEGPGENAVLALASMEQNFVGLALADRSCTSETKRLDFPTIHCARGSAERDSWFSQRLAQTQREINAGVKTVHPSAPAPVVSMFSVYCNNCSMAIPDVHFHCSTCDDGDFDLCPECNDAGVTCHGDHWLIKRIVDKGKYIHSTTETLPPKKKSSEFKPTRVALAVEEEKVPVPTRTCNRCISELSEGNFVTCIDCDDFDLCIQCHISLKHGHNPKHAFAFVDEDANHGLLARSLLAPGRNTAHAAVCDGCDKYIFGVRHKCLDCPDWDYCVSCIANAPYIHPRHRFVPLYESLYNGARQQVAKVRHHGIFCDGPLCNQNDSMSTYITGDRYKCAVCHDTDFCASCEASPSNLHNKTHPLIKFKTPVRNVSVTTFGDHSNGKAMPPMGDRRSDNQTTSKATETIPAQSINAATQVLTVAEVKPTEVKSDQPIKVEEPAKVEEAAEVEEAAKAEEAAEELPAPVEEGLVAHFVRDAVADGTIMTSNSVFEQTWYLRNGGKTSWPAGCSVRFVGGDNMCAVDPDHPASVHELVSASESTTCYTEVAPGQEYGFTVLMRTPNRAGNFISYWRLTTPTGEKFGHRLWCDITVNEPTPVIKEEPMEEESSPSMFEVLKSLTLDSRKAPIKVESSSNDDAASVKAEGSQMIFPKLDKESPISSMHEEAQHAPQEVTASEEVFNDDFEEFNENFEDEEVCEDGFMTDEEYDILDASDEEYLAEQESASKK